MSIRGYALTIAILAGALFWAVVLPAIHSSVR